MDWELTIAQVSELAGAVRSVGHYAGAVRGIADLRTAGPGQLSFLTGGKYAKLLADCAASVVLVPEDQTGEPAQAQLWLHVKDPSVALARICAHIEALLELPPLAGVHPTAVIDASVQLGANVSIGPYCILEAGVELGEGVVLQSHVRVCRGSRIGAKSRLLHGVWVGPRTQIGARCLLHPGAVIGGEGFGFHSNAQGHHKLPQIGNVVLEDDVEVGCNSTIDRARFASTRIGAGTKIDNLVQVGHNCVIGRHCILCAGVGIAGSSELGNFVILAGQVGVNGHIRIGDGVQATGKTGISKDIAPGLVLSGVPAQPRRDELRLQVALRRVPELLARVAELEKRLAAAPDVDK